jgi:trigger factor
VSKVKDAGPFERILTLTISEEAITAGRKTAARRLASEVKVKGFRPGKAPMQVVESVVGAATLRREAIDDALPAVVTAAIAETDLKPAVTPRLENIRDEDDGVEVDVLITLWPTLKKLPKYKGRKVEVSTPVVSDTDVEDQIERMRNQFADLEDVEREAFEGDFVIVDVTTSKEGAEFAAGSATDMLFEVGAGMFLDGMDDALRGKGAGAIEQFSSTLPQSFGDDGGAEVNVRVLVKQVKAKRLPELTDEWVDDMTEFESVAEMKLELRKQLIKIRHQGARVEFERVLLEQLLEALELELPEALSDAEMDSVFHRFAHRLEQQGIEFGQYLAITGQDQATFVADLRSQADVNLKTRILLEAVAEAEELTVEESEMESTVAELALASKMEIADYKQALAEGGQENALSGDILRRKAVDRLLELAVPVDGDGNELDLSPSDEDEADGDGAPDKSGGKQEPDVTADAEDAPADTDTE